MSNPSLASPSLSLDSRARASVVTASLGLLLGCVALEAAPRTSPAPPGLVPVAAADFAPPRVPTPGELVEAGWSPAEGRRIAPELVRPRIPVQRGASLLASAPDRLPRPSVRLGETQVPVPLAAHQRLLERHETSEGPLLRWTPRFELVQVSASALILGVDALPYQYRARPDHGDVRSALQHAKRRLAASAPSLTSRHSVDPGRTFRLERRPEPPDGTPVTSGLQCRPLTSGVEGDALLVTLDGGVSWWELLLGDQPNSSDLHALDATRAFVDAGRVYVAPLPLAPDAARELMLVEPPETSMRPLPFPTPPGAAWRCELSDLRRNEKGLEALVMVHDPRLRREAEQEAAPSWAARLRLGDGSWLEIERIPLPGDARALRLRFNTAATGLLLHHADRLLGRRALMGS